MTYSIDLDTEYSQRPKITNYVPIIWTLITDSPIPYELIIKDATNSWNLSQLLAIAIKISLMGATYLQISALLGFQSSHNPIVQVNDYCCKDEFFRAK